MRNNLVRDLRADESVLVCDFLRIILRLEETSFPVHLINQFLKNYAAKFLAESNLAKVCIINNQIAGIILCATQNINSQPQKDIILKRVPTDLQTCTSLQQTVEYLKQIAVINTIDTFIKCKNINNCLYNNRFEIKLLAVLPQFQNQGVAKSLIRHAINELGINKLWLVTDSNSNWKYYETNGYKLLDKTFVSSSDHQRYRSIDGSDYQIMIYLHN